MRFSQCFRIPDWVNSVVFSAGGELLFSGNSDGTVKVWNVAAR